MRPINPTASQNQLRVGARLRASRKAQGLTIAQLAQAAHVTTGFVSRVERDETSPSVSTLVSLCQVLSLPVGSLFEEITTDVVELALAPLINMGGRGATERLLTPRSQSGVQVLRSRLAPQSTGGDALYTINCAVEVVHVVTGTISMLFFDRKVDMKTGDTLTFSGREPHNWENTSTQEADVMWTIVPAAWSGSA